MTHGRPSPSRSRSAPPWRPPRRGSRWFWRLRRSGKPKSTARTKSRRVDFPRLIQAVDDRERRRETVEVEFGEGAVAVDVDPGDLHVSSPATESRATEVASSTSRPSRSSSSTIAPSGPTRVRGALATRRAASSAAGGRIELDALGEREEICREVAPPADRVPVDDRASLVADLVPPAERLANTLVITQLPHEIVGSAGPGEGGVQPSTPGEPRPQDDGPAVGRGESVGGEIAEVAGERREVGDALDRALDLLEPDAVTRHELDRIDRHPRGRGRRQPPWRSARSASGCGPGCSRGRRSRDPRARSR